MAGKGKLLQENYDFNDEEEIIAHEELIKELAQESEEVWMDAIDDEYMEIQHVNSSNSWIVEDNQDALAEYMDDVSDAIVASDIDDFDW